jgi:hypothetical protein
VSSSVCLSVHPSTYTYPPSIFYLTTFLSFFLSFFPFLVVLSCHDGTWHERTVTDEAVSYANVGTLEGTSRLHRRLYELQKLLKWEITN